MTSSRSFFSPAIFLNNLKRFKWGSFLYGIFLFFAVPFQFLIESVEYFTGRYTYVPETQKIPMILSDSYIIIPLLFAVAVPTIAAVLIFNNVHSPKQSVFVHALPVTRVANYISDLVSGIVLMALPVIANGIILLIMSFTEYSVIITSGSVVYWVFLNFSVLFIMFSIASATAFLTGNTAVHIGLNGFAHILPMIVALFITVAGEVFLYGFMVTDNFISNEIITYTPLVWLFSKALNFGAERVNMFGEWVFWAYIAMSLVFYYIGYLLYRVRKIELSGDVCAFSIFRPIFKYMATASVAIFTFAMGQSIFSGYVYFEIAVASAITYFACEMIINKSFRVFGSYKGLLAFYAIGAAILIFLGTTSVFGYETRIPKTENIESAAIHENYLYEDIVVAEETLIENVRETHKEIIENREEGVRQKFIYVTYKLKNGAVLRREYMVEKAVFDDAMAKMYENEEYKFNVTELSELNIANVNDAELQLTASGFEHREEIRGEEAAALLRAVEEDVKALSYGEIKEDSSTLQIHIEVACTQKENLEHRIFKGDEDEKEVVYVSEGDIIRSFDITINKNFKNTFEFLRSNGYYEKLVSVAAEEVWILREPIEFDGEFYYYNGEKRADREVRMSASGSAKLSAADGRLAVEAMLADTRNEEKVGKNYCVFINSNEVENIWVPGNSFVINEKDLPDYMKKYL